MKVLLIAPSFPPFSGVGSLRSYSLANYLKENGDEVYVIRNSMSSWGEKNCKSPCNEFDLIIDIDIKKDFLEAAEQYTVAISEVLEKNSVDVIIYSCSPYYIAVSAVSIKKKYHIPTIIDYRDLWIDDEFLTRNILKRLKKTLIKIPYRKFERESVEYADLILTVTPDDCDFLGSKYRQYKNKIRCILNGYDEARIKNDDVSIDLPNLPNTFIGVFGKFGYYDYKYAVELLNAVSEINSQGQNIKVVHVGAIDKTTEKAIEATGFNRVNYVNTGYLDYAIGMRIIKKSLANCLIVHYRRALGTKAFDYIYSDRPIIYFAQKGSAVDRLLDKGKYTYRCTNKRSAVNAIKKILNDKIKSNGIEGIENYSREKRNEEYRAMIFECIASTKE